MKKKDFNSKLKLSKNVVSNLTNVKGGRLITGGCTDGCSPLQTAWNCTQTNCSADCPPAPSYSGNPCTDSNAICD